MSDSIGKVKLDLETNYGPFQQQLNGIAGKSTNMVKSAFLGLGKVMAGVFAVTKLVQFGKASIDLASDLQEVQNVVDVVFGESSGQINNFAKNAITSYGLSELSAKRYASTMGAMLKSMGLGQEQVVGMSQSITALAGDMASFYNLNSDDAFNKIRAGISGETEPLKQLGINMSVANMEAFALSQGISKSYQKMTQSEQALLRYNYLLSTTADAQGDFARTSNSWANQTRILSEQFNSLKATLGSAFIAVLTPVVRMLNWVISKLQIAANYFKTFVEAITGVKAETSSASSGMEGIADSATEAGDATVAAAKKAKGALAGFDKLNVLSSSDGDSGSSGSGGTTGLDIPSMSGMDMAFPEPDTSGAEASVNKVKAMFEGLKTYITTAFAPSIKSWGKAFTDLKKPFTETLNSIKSNLSDLWTNGISPFGSFLMNEFIPNTVNTLSENLAPAFTNVMTAAFNAFQKIGNSVTGLWTETLFPFAQYVLSDFIGGLTTSFTETFAPIFSDVLPVVISEFSKDFEFACVQVKNFVNDILKPALELVKTVFQDALGIIKNEWNKSGAMLLEKFQAFKETFREIWNNLYQNIIKPVWDKIIGGLRDLWDQHLKPLWEKIVQFFSKLGEAIMTVWNNFLAPLVDWIIKTFGPIFVSQFGVIWDTVKAVVGNIIDAVKNVFSALGGILDFITGVFSGNWKKAWEGLKTAFKGVWDAIVNIVKAPINMILGFINRMLNGITSGVNLAIKALNKLSFKVPNWIPLIGGQQWGFNIKEMVAPQIPYLAKGGIIDQPTLAMVGESGKEAVVPLENTSFADAIANAILKVLAPLFANGNSIGKNSDGTQVIILKIGEYELGRVTVGAINKYHNIIGKVELEV